MIKAQKQRGKDDYQTPPEALIPLLPQLKENWVIWECASGQGNVVKELRKRGFKVIATDIHSGKPFAFLLPLTTLEYGTTDYKVIEVQNIGIPKHLAIFILKKHPDCLRFEERSLVDFDHVKLLSKLEEGLPERIELEEIFEFEGM